MLGVGSEVGHYYKSLPHQTSHGSHLSLPIFRSLSD